MEATKKMVPGVGISISNTEVIFSHPSEIELIGRCAENKVGKSKCKPEDCSNKDCSYHMDHKDN